MNSVLLILSIVFTFFSYKKIRHQGNLTSKKSEQNVLKKLWESYENYSEEKREGFLNVILNGSSTRILFMYIISLVYKILSIIFIKINIKIKIILALITIVSAVTGLIYKKLSMKDFKERILQKRIEVDSKVSFYGTITAIINIIFSITIMIILII